MKRKDDTLAILFVTALTVVVWLWAANNTKHTSNEATVLNFKAPVGSNTTISPASQPIELTFEGPRAAVDAAKVACSGGLNVSLTLQDGKQNLADLVNRINQLDLIKDTGAEVTATSPTSISLEIQTIEDVEASVEPTVQKNVTTVGDFTVDPPIVTLSIPKELKGELPDVLVVEAHISDTLVARLQPGVMHTIDVGVKLSGLHGDIRERITISPETVKVSFKLESKTKKTTLDSVPVLIVGPADEYSKYSVTLHSNKISNVTIEANTDIVKGINEEKIKVFALLRLKASDMEQYISNKQITTFLAIMEDGKGKELKSTVEDSTQLDIELTIELANSPSP
jgi:hypothetical protein